MGDLQKTGELLIPAIAYGDAAGLPVETWTAHEIKLKYGWLNQLISTEGNPFFNGEHEPGTWSDDTQLSIAVTEGLMSADGFDLEVQAEKHIEAYYETPEVEWRGELKPRGWGGSTTNSVRRLIDRISPLKSGEPNGSGNGILMKMAPLVYWQVARGIEEEERYAQYDALTRMTHDSDVAVICSRLHGDVLDYLLRTAQDEDEFVDNIAEFILERAIYHEQAVQPICNEISTALHYLERGDMNYAPEKILNHTDGKGFYAPQTLAMAYGAFLHMPGDFRYSVYEAVNLGGDTDSIASIVAAMINFAEGGDIELSDDAFVFLKDFDRLRIISHRLARAALQLNNKE